MVRQEVHDATSIASTSTWSSLEWLSVDEALPLRLMDRKRRAFAVLHLPRVVPEGELADVAVEVLTADGVECAVEAALQQAEEALDRVRVNVAAHVLVLPVVHRLMRWKLAFEVA